jgi:uncharacterized protein YacL
MLPDSFKIILAFVISMVITWTLGLMIPLIIRYVIVRKPMSKGISFLIAAINFFLNLYFWIYIGMLYGGGSKTHYVQYVMACVAFYLLSNGYVKKQNDKKPSGKLEGKSLSFRDFIDDKPKEH